MSELPIEKIIEIANSNELALHTLRVLSRMEKSRPTTDLSRFKVRVAETYKQSFTYKELLLVFKEFQNIGLGKLILSRDLTRAPHRFNWAFDNVEVGNTINSMPQGTGAPRGAVGVGVGVAPPPNAVVLNYPIRGVHYPLSLPPDLTASEARELAAFITRFGR